MIRRRIIYLVTLAAVLAFQITNNNYLAQFLLALCLALPILSLTLSLAAMRGCRLVLSARPMSVSRGSDARWEITVENPRGLPIPRLTARLEYKNLLTGTKQKKKLVLTGATEKTPVLLPADTGHCGLLELRAVKFRVCDYLGLFSLRRPLPEPVRLPVEPVPIPPGPLNIPEGQGQRAQPGGAGLKGKGEDYDLREYRPGDPMRSVHWKLSSKWDDLIVKEGVDTLIPLPLLTFDRFGTPEQLDRTLDRLTGYSHALLAMERPHAILWMEGKTSRLCSVSAEKELSDCLLTILAAPLPSSGTSILQQPEQLRGPGGPVFHLHVTAREEENP